VSAIDKQLSRRTILALSGACVALTAIPSGFSAGDLSSASVPKLPVCPDIARKLREVHRLRAEAVEVYRTTGDSGLIWSLRLTARNRFGYSLGLQARNEKDWALFREAGALLAELEAEFPEVPWPSGTKERYAVLRRWAEAGGQFNLCYLPDEAKRTGASGTLV